MKKIKTSKRLASLLVCAVMLVMVAIPMNVNAAVQYDISTSFTRTSALNTSGTQLYSPSYQGEDMVLDVYMPNFSGSDWVQGTVYLVNYTDGTYVSQDITNTFRTNQTLTFPNLDFGDQYYFYYSFTCFGTSNTGYLQTYVK